MTHIRTPWTAISDGARRSFLEVHANSEDGARPSPVGNTTSFDRCATPHLEHPGQASKLLPLARPCTTHSHPSSELLQ